MHFSSVKVTVGMIQPTIGNGVSTRHSPNTGLTPRECEVLSQVFRGKANKEIAVSLDISVRTVKFHLSNLLQKYQVQSRGELVYRAFQKKPSGHQSV